MATLETFLALMVVLVALAAIAPRLHVPYPILLVIAGLAIGFIPGMPRLQVDPEVIFLLFVPPLVYYGAYFSSLYDLRANAGTIAGLAVGLVLATIAGVAWVAHRVLPGFGWALAWTLGAVVSTPDASAVLPVLKNVNLPRRLESIIEGESLLADPMGFVSYGLGVAAVVSGHYTVGRAGIEFLYTALGGALLGLAVGYLLFTLRRHMRDPMLAITLSLLSPFAAFLPAERLGVSGVTATLAAGLYMGYNLPKLDDPDIRMQSLSVWRTLTFLLSGFAFILLGMEMPDVLARLATTPRPTLFVEAGWIVLAVFVVRAIWVVLIGPGGHLTARLTHGRVRPLSWREQLIVWWNGMRGMDTLVTALALPFVTATGAPFPGRDLIVFLAGATIFATLVLEGLTLAGLVKWLGLRDGGADFREESYARLMASHAALRRLDERICEDPGLKESDWPQRLQQRYRLRLRRLEARVKGNEDAATERSVDLYHSLLRDALDAEHEAILMLRDEGRISSETMHKIEQEIDIERLGHRH